MFFSEARFRILQKSFFHLSIMLIALVALSISLVMNSKSTSNLNNAHTTVLKLQKQNREFRELLTKYQANIKSWDEGLYRKKREGLNLQLAREKIENLRIKNNIYNLSANLTSPNVRSDIRGLKFAKLVYSRMNISLSAHSDTDILHFVSNLSQELTGVLQFINLEMKVVKPNKIRANIGFIVYRMRAN